MTALSYIVLVSVTIFLILSSLYEIPLKNGSLNSICQSQKYERVKEKGFLSDKLKVKEYMNKNFPEIKTSKIIYETSNPEDLRKFKFPDNFVMKCSSGARMFHIVNNGKYNIEELIEKAKTFLKTNFSNQGYRSIPFFGFKEPHYNYNSKKIIIEEYLENIEEFRIMMFKGQVIYYEKTNPTEEGIFYNNNFHELEDIKTMKTTKNSLEKNILIKKIEKFCKDFYEKESFELTRMDFYITKDMKEFYFGEITFTPENCRYKYSNKFNDYFKKIQL